MKSGIARGAEMDEFLPAKFRLSLLGRFELTGSEGAVELPSKKLAGLLAYLAYTAPEPQSREKLATLLWGSHFEAQARQNLRQALFRLRRALGADALISGAGEMVSVNPDLVASDVQRFKALIRDGNREALAEAVSLYNGWFLADVTATEEAWTDWVNTERQRLEDLALESIVRLGEVELELGHAERSLELGERASKIDQLSERSHRLVISSLSALGRRSDALKRFDRITDLLKRELGVAPEAATISLAASIRRVDEHQGERPIAHPRNPGLAEVGRVQREARLSPQFIPSIAVLPFRNASGSDAENYFGEGVTEEIITSLARSQTLCVIARHSTLQFRNHDRELGEIARALNVRYLLDGSVRRHSNRLRINAQLIDGEDGRTLWAEHYDGDETDVFEFQDRIAASIAPIVEPQVYRAEVAKALRKPTESLAAYDCLLRALSLMYSFDDERFANAGRYLDQAIALDPNYALPFGYKAWWYNLLLGEGRSKDRVGDTAAAIEFARKAMALDNNDAFILAVAGHTQALLLKRTDLAVDLFESALRVNRSSAFAWAQSATTRSYRGEPDDAVERLEKAFRLSPHDLLNFLFWNGAGIAHFVAGRYEVSLEWLHRSRQANPRFVSTYRMMVGCLAMLRRIGEARTVARDLLVIDPGFRISKFAEWYPLLPEDLARLVQGMKSAGLPE